MENINQEALEFIKDRIDNIITDSNDIDERQQKIIRLRFGLDDKGPIKIKELAKIFEVSPRKMKYEVEAIERKVFNKIKKQI